MREILLLVGSATQLQTEPLMMPGRAWCSLNGAASKPCKVEGLFLESGLGSVRCLSTALDDIDSRGPELLLILSVPRNPVCAGWPSAFVCITQLNVHQQNHVYIVFILTMQ